MDQPIIQKLDKLFVPYPSAQFRKGSIIITAGKEPSGVFYIQKGVVRKYWISENGEEMTLNLYKAHTFIPMSWAIGNIPVIHFYEAMTDVTAKRVPKQDVLKFIHDEPDILYNLLQRIFVGMEGLWMQLKSINAGNSYAKLAASLFILAKRFGIETKKGTLIDLEMSGQDLAHYASMSRETVSRELQKLKKEKIVSFDKGEITIVDLGKLESALVH